MFRTCAAAVLGLVVLAVPGVASAQTWISPDAAGDVRSLTFVPENPPCEQWVETDGVARDTADITWLTVRHRRTGVDVAVQLTDLRHSRSRSVSATIATPRRTFSVDRSLARSERYGPSLSLVEPPPDLPPGQCGYFAAGPPDVPCEGLRAEVDVRRDRVVFHVPRRCLDDPAWVRAGASTTDLGEDVNYYDDWSPTAGEHGYPQPLGRRVRLG